MKKVTSMSSDTVIEVPTITLVSPQNNVSSADECAPQPCLPSEDDKCKPNW